jgi:Copper binding proteins, plastocyanin/azurin family
MRRITTVVIALTVVLAIAVAGALGAPSATTLTGVDGPGFTITLKKGSAKVTSLQAGAYKFVIQDKSNIHNFHLRGPGVNKMTSVSAVANSTWNVTLKKGKYTYVCDPHAPAMKGSFTVK